MLLHYATPDSRRRTWARGIVIALCVIIAGEALRRVASPWVARAAALRPQAQCMSHRLPADFVAYDDDRVESARLIGLPGRRFVPLWYAADCLAPDWRGPGPRPPPLAAPAGFRCDEWERLGNHGWGLVFMHRRLTRNGSARLVVVQASPGVANDYAKAPSLRAATYIPAAWSDAVNSPRSDDQRDTHGYFSFHMSRAERLRIFAGQPDPHDPSRFTIDYELNGERGQVEGFFNKLGELKLRLVCGPTGRLRSPG
jgi:hypothetical protein